MVEPPTHRQHQLPLPRADETLYSLVGRIRSRNVYRSDVDACRQLLGWVSNCRVDDYPVDFGYFCAETNYEYGASESVLERYTLFPYFARTGRFPWHSGAAKRSPLEVRHGIGLLSYGAHRAWRICASCVEEEKAELGDTYWHRSHQLPMSLICCKHLCPLLWLNQGNIGVRNRFLLPEDVYSDCKYWKSGCVLECWNCLAKIDLALLKSGSTAITSGDHAIAALLHAMEELDLVDRGRAVHKSALENFINASLADMQLPAEWVHRMKCRSTHIAVTALSSMELPPSPYFSLLIYQLFRYWEAFEERCRWEAIMANEDLKRHSASPSITSNVDIHRKACITLLEQTPTMRRSELSRAAPKAFRWLLTHDRQWLDQLLPWINTSKQLQLLLD